MNTSTSIQNRNQAYFDSLEELPKSRKQVFNMIKKYGPISSQEIARMLMFGINRVSGRITELQKTFHINSAGSKKNSYSKHRNTLWVSINNFSVRIDLINAEFVKLRDEKDSLINDLNIGELSEFSRVAAKTRITKINKLINNLENLLK